MRFFQSLKKYKAMNFNLEIFSHYLVQFDPFALHFPESWPIAGVRWYGLAYLAGFVLGLLMFNLYTKKGRSPLSYDQNSSMLSYQLLGIILGARLGYCIFYNLEGTLSNPLSIFQIWNGGMSSHGGFIGVLIATFLFSKIHKVAFLTLADLIVTVVGPGIFFGRLANFINGELWGKISNAPWAMIFPHSAPMGTPLEKIAARHPSQLYEALAEGLLIFLILQFRFWVSKPKRGQICGEFLILYSIARIFCEMFREPDSALILGFSKGTFYSVFCLIAGLGFIFWAHISAKKNPNISS